MIDLTQPLADLVHLVASGQTTAVALVQTALDRIEATTEYHTVLEVNPDALASARRVDQRVAAGEDLPLAGLPFGAKDNYLTSSTHTTAASHILEPFRAPFVGPAIERLEAAGAIMVAKLNLDAFGHGGSTENSDYGPTRNPYDLDRVPGGSSGGSAAAVALGQVAFAIGTDTGGSLRLPASYCGVVGFKPTYGLIPRSGVVAMASSTDVLGPLTNRAVDAGLLLDVLAGSDPSDATTIERDPAGYAMAPSDLEGLKIGLINEYMTGGVAPTIRHGITQIIADLESHGATVTPVSLPATELALAAYYIIVPAEISSNLARYDGVRFGHSSDDATNLNDTYLMSRDEGFGDEAKRRIMIGTYVLSSGYYDAYYKRAQRVRTSLIEEFDRAFNDFDLLLGPTGPTPAFTLGAKSHEPVAMYLNDVMTVAVNLVGCPAVSLPAGRDGELPYGLQLIAPRHAERRLLGAAMATEAVIGDWRSR
jgi:aspartyl-tRNA(Asn)/glutamyl-tRNA(Gln) amidotransferase subunit A